MGGLVSKDNQEPEDLLRLATKYKVSSVTMPVMVTSRCLSARPGS